MAENDFVLAVGTDGKKRRVPAHYLDNPAFGFRLPPSTQKVVEPAAAQAKTTIKEPAAAGETKEVRS